MEPTANKTPAAKPHLMVSSLHRAIEMVMVKYPELRLERICVSGRGSMQDLIKDVGLDRHPRTIREALHALGYKTTGSGGIAEGVRSREHLDRVVNEVVNANPQWADGVKVRGPDGLKQKLKDRQIDASQLTLVRVLERIGRKQLGRGFVRKPTEVPPAPVAAPSPSAASAA